MGENITHQERKLRKLSMMNRKNLKTLEDEEDEILWLALTRKEKIQSKKRSKEKKRT